MSRNNIVWDYFKKDPSDVSKALCLECNKLYSLGSDKPAQQTLHGLKKHLEKCHKTTNAIYSKRVSEREAIQSAEKKQNWMNHCRTYCQSLFSLVLKIC
jgi:predicted NAD/FAD-binding protein